MTEQEGVKNQNHIDFSVQILDAVDNKTVVGTGIAVSLDGEIVTCVHVVRDALQVDDPRKHIGADVGVYFPQLTDRPDEAKVYQAKIERCFHDSDDDVILLRTTDGSMPLRPEQMPILGSAHGKHSNPFLAYGFAPIPPYKGGTVEGMVGYPVERDDLKLQKPYFELLNVRGIEGGLSGSGVLDTKTNLVIGLLSERRKATSEHDMPRGWAVDGHVLSLEPLGLKLETKAVPKQPAPTPKSPYAKQLRELARTDSAIEFIGAPPPLDEWVGREMLLKEITKDYADSYTHIVGLIGFGGEGKSSIARRWLDDLRKDKNHPQPSGTFWWSFYDKPSSDDFLEAALNFLVRGKIDLHEYNSVNAKVQAVGEITRTHRYLFVLDGFEVMQHNEGDQFGLIRSTNLKNLLELFAGAGHESFCLITSRIPLHDLIPYTSYTQRDVTRLSTSDGRKLLRRVGVTGDEAKIDALVEAWDGHALTITLLGAYLKDIFGGNIEHADEITPPLADEDRYERVHRVLRRYDEHLTDEQKSFLTLFSAFRLPVKPDSFGTVFRAHTSDDAINTPITKMSDDEFSEMVDGLVEYRILKYDKGQDYYTTHLLIRNHYFILLIKVDTMLQSDTHTAIAKYYLELAGLQPPEYVFLLGNGVMPIQPLTEAIHHLCRAGNHDFAGDIYNSFLRRERLHIQNRGVVETDLEIMLQFFANGDTDREPKLSNPKAKGFVLNQIGIDLNSLGRITEVNQYYERSAKVSIDQNDFQGASTSYNNMSEVSVHLGNLHEAKSFAEQAIRFAQKSMHEGVQELSFGYLAWIEHLLGNIDKAQKHFEQGIRLLRSYDATMKYPYSLTGCYYATHLRRLDNPQLALEVTEHNVKVLLNSQIQQRDISICKRVFGELATLNGEHNQAILHYTDALRIAGELEVQFILIEALWAKGLWLAKYHTELQPLDLADLDEAFNLLNEALGYCVNSGYKLYEVDVRIGLAWAYVAQENFGAARPQILTAKRISEETGYYWGKVDAEEVEKRLP